MKVLIAILVITGALLSFPVAQAQSAGGVDGENIHCNLPISIVSGGGLQAGIINACASFPNKVPYENSQWIMTTTYNGPLPSLGSSIAVSVNTVIGAGSSCSRTTIATQTSTVGSYSQTQEFQFTQNGPICAGYILFRASLVAGSVDFIYSVIAFNVQVEKHYQMNYFCAATGDDPAAFVANTNICSTPNVNVPDIAAEVDELRSNLCRPTGNHGHCELDIHGGLDVAVTGISGNTTNNGTVVVEDSGLTVAQLIIPLVLFALMIIWAETKQQPMLYLLAILTGIIVVVGLNFAIETRSILVAVILYLAWRLFNINKEINEQDA